MKTETTNLARPANLIAILPTDLRAWLPATELARAARDAAETFYWLEADEEDHTPFGGSACPLRKLAALTYCYATGTLADDLIALEMVEDPALRSLTGDAVFAPDKLRLFRAHNAELIKLCLARVLEQAWRNHVGEGGMGRSFFAAEASHRVQLAWQASRVAAASALTCSSRREEALDKAEWRVSDAEFDQRLVTSAATGKGLAAVVLLAVLLCLLPAHAEETLPPFKLDGRTITNAVVIEANPVDVLIR
jgi:hypothetical protein